MTESEALKILELSPDAGEREIKTKYRQLIRRYIRDIHGSSEERYTRHARDQPCLCRIEKKVCRKCRYTTGPRKNFLPIPREKKNRRLERAN